MQVQLLGLFLGAKCFICLHNNHSIHFKIKASLEHKRALRKRNYEDSFFP